MRVSSFAAKSARVILPAMAALALSACGGEPEEKTYEVDAEDLSGGELIVNPVDPEAVPVDIPDVEMTPVAEDAAEMAAEEAPAAE